jgi:hypothetical protein
VDGRAQAAQEAGVCPPRSPPPKAQCTRRPGSSPLGAETPGAPRGAGRGAQAAPERCLLCPPPARAGHPRTVAPDGDGRRQSCPGRRLPGPAVGRGQTPVFPFAFRVAGPTRGRARANSWDYANLPRPKGTVRPAFSANESARCCTPRANEHARLPPTAHALSQSGSEARGLALCVCRVTSTLRGLCFLVYFVSYHTFFFFFLLGDTGL